jgi:hypothetical protein
MTDNEFIAAFENCTLPLEAFHHADHVKMAFLYLSRYPLLEAIRQFSASLVKFATAHGKTNLYNQTITWAYLIVMQERLARAGRQETWAEFAARNPDLLNWKDGVLRKYYRDETLKSDLAKGSFLFPDRIGT